MRTLNLLLLSCLTLLLCVPVAYSRPLRAERRAAAREEIRHEEFRFRNDFVRDGFGERVIVASPFFVGGVGTVGTYVSPNLNYLAINEVNPSVTVVSDVNGRIVFRAVNTPISVGERFIEFRDNFGRPVVNIGGHWRIR